jgi:hypothetical protein
MSQRFNAKDATNEYADVAGDSPGSGNRSGWMDYIPVAFLLIPLTLLFGALFWKVSADRADAFVCLQQGVEQRSREFGRLRQAGPDFFVQSNRWRRLTNGCHGKARQSCLKNNPGSALLEKNLGEPVVAEFCGDHAVAYEINGQRLDVISRAN